MVLRRSRSAVKTGSFSSQRTTDCADLAVGENASLNHTLFFHDQESSIPAANEPCTNEPDWWMNSKLLSSKDLLS